MARRDVVPISQISRRAPEAGRIRIGVKSGKAMKSIDTFRFTSHNHDLIHQLAAEFGGEVKAWNDPKARIKNQLEVITRANRLPVYVPANGLSQHYEMWSGGGCLRRCDGVTVEQVEMHGAEAVPVSSPCICAAKDRMECRPYTRMNLVLPQLPFAGTWRLETKGWNAAAELPGMFEMVRALDESGRMVQAILGLEQRTDVTAGQTRHFVVPTLTIAESPLQIQAGQAAVGAIGAGARAELGGARAALTSGFAPLDETSETGNDDDEPIDAEIVDEAELALVAKLRSDAEQHNLDADRFVAAVRSIDGDFIEVATKIHDDVINERVIPVGFKTDQTIRWRRSS